HPDVWLARGLWAQRHGEPRVSVRCLWEAVRRFPDSRTANYHLGQTLLQLDPPQAESAAPFLERAERREERRNTLNMVYRKKESLPHIEQAARLTKSLGRLWEAAGWLRLALQLAPDSDEARLTLRRLAEQLARDTPRVLADFDPTR